MPHERLRFALEQLTSGDWLLFERFCSEFLVADFPQLHTTASPSGDRGRDAQLFQVNGVPATGFQYSVTADWSGKIRATLRTVTENQLGLRRIIYCTNQQIGARADPIIDELWEAGIRLDIRDREWFCERELDTTARQSASNELATRIVDPITSSRGLAETVGAPLSNSESKVALVHLALNAHDRVGDRNLTRTSFDALVRAALIDSSQEATLSAEEITALVQKMVPQGGPAQVADLVKSALVRLSKKHGPVKYRSDSDRYHLGYEATEEWRASAAEYLLNQQSLEQDLMAAAYGHDSALDDDLAALREEGVHLRQALESVMLRSGEGFVAAVEGADPIHLSHTEIAEQLAGLSLGMKLSPETAAVVIEEVIAGPAERTKVHLLRVLDAYTLLAFLQQTPDVQRSMSHVFASAKIWLDTSTVLPLMAERLIDEDDQRQQTSLLAAAVSSGVHLYVTDGVIEELRFHLERCLTYLNYSGKWEGDPPYIYSAYMLSGRDERQFNNWLQEFRGDVNPEQDLSDYLRHHFDISLRSLAESASKAEVPVRAAVQELFRRQHRSKRDGRRNENIIDRLAAHDVENVLGVLGLRSASSPALGHEAWWLTLDRSAVRLQGWLREQLGRNAPDSPVLSPDYLSQLLRLGPLRRTLTEEATQLPLVVDISRLETVPVGLIEQARKTRLEFAGFDELRIRREVRDALSRLRTTMRAQVDYAREARSGLNERIVQQKNWKTQGPATPQGR